MTFYFKDGSQGRAEMPPITFDHMLAHAKKTGRPVFITLSVRGQLRQYEVKQLEHVTRGE